MALPKPDLDALLARLGPRVTLAERQIVGPRSEGGAEGGAEGGVRGEGAFGEAHGGAVNSTFRGFHWNALNSLLPKTGLPFGIVELQAPSLLNGLTRVALSAIRRSHARDGRSVCAWVDPEGSLYGPGVAFAGVDLRRLLVVRVPESETMRATCKLLRSGAFDVVVVDGVRALRGALQLDARQLDGRRHDARHHDARHHDGRRHDGRRLLDATVKRCAVLAEESGATVLLLTDSRVPRSLPLPVALRLECAFERDAGATGNGRDAGAGGHGSRAPEQDERALWQGADGLRVTVTKDRHGAMGLAKTVPIATSPRLCPSTFRTFRMSG